MHHAPRSTLHAPRSTLHAPRSTLARERTGIASAFDGAFLPSLVGLAAAFVAENISLPPRACSTLRNSCCSSSCKLGSRPAPSVKPCCSVIISEYGEKRTDVSSLFTETSNWCKTFCTISSIDASPSPSEPMPLLLSAVPPVSASVASSGDSTVPLPTKEHHTKLRC